MITKRLVDLIVSDFVRALDEAQKWIIQIDNKSAFMPPGQNGPHYHLETPVRNTAHWSVAYLIAAEHDLFSEAASISLLFRNWLLNDNPHYQQGCYVLRQSGRSDWCNGVIGNAWVLEALARFGMLLHDKRAESRAFGIVQNSRFNKSAGAWHRYDPFTKRFSIDFTFDHQAWFAAALCDLQTTGNVSIFLDHCLQGAFRVRNNGLIHHLFFAPSLKNYINRLQYKLSDLKSPERSRTIEEGYQIYTLFPLARIKHHISNHPFFESKIFQAALDFCTKENILKMQINRYGFQYNAPGLELPMLALIFGDQMSVTEEDIEDIYNAQNQHTRTGDSALYTHNNPDPLTLSARIYELALFIEAYYRENLA